MIRALYAEDDPNIAAIVRSYIEHFAPDWKLEVVPNGKECLERMAKGGLDILLLDYVLPDTDGLQILSELTRRGSTVPVVMVTGHGQTEFAVRALRAGAADCVDKTSPQFLQLVEIVRRVQVRDAERRLSRPATAPMPGHHSVMLIEGSPATCAGVSEFFATHAPEFDLALAANATDLDRFLATGAAADAVIIGPNPPGNKSLEVLRLVQYRNKVPTLLLAAQADSDTAVAAFKLGAQDFIIQKPEYHTELVFSLNSVIRRAEMERQNLRLARQLDELNQSLEAQVAARTRELRALSLRLLRIQEEERHAIARELHDEVGQLLTGLLFQLEAARRANRDESLRPGLAEANATATSLLEHVRILTQQYRPRVLDDLGLQPALEWHAKLFGKQTGIAVTLDLTLPPARLPGDLEIVVYRVAQEALTNVARHAQAKAATVTVTCAELTLILEITDRGRGFDLAQKLAQAESFGLTGMRERVNLVGGKLEFFSQPGSGTRVHAEFPLPAVPAQP
jgi:signal transduction histidine kinase/CheY-like chemotaxis protein